MKNNIYIKSRISFYTKQVKKLQLKLKTTRNIWKKHIYGKDIDKYNTVISELEQVLEIMASNV